MRIRLALKPLTAIAVVTAGALAQAQTIFIDSLTTDQAGGPGFSNEASGLADGIGGDRVVRASNSDGTATWKVQDGALEANTFGPGDVIFSYSEAGIGDPPQFGSEADYSDYYITLELGAGSQAGVLAFSQDEFLSGSGGSIIDPRRNSLSLHYYNLPAVTEDTVFQLLTTTSFTSRGFAAGAPSAPQWRDSFSRFFGADVIRNQERVNSFRFTPGRKFEGVGTGTGSAIFSDLPSNVPTVRLVVNSVTLNPVPEPGTMIALAAAGALFLRRRRSA